MTEEEAKRIRGSTCKVKTLIKFLEGCNPDASVVMKSDYQLLSMIKGIGPIGGSHSLLNEDYPMPGGCVCLYESIGNLGE